MKHHHHTTVVSSIGTSILTNHAGPMLDLLKRTANIKSIDTFGEERRVFETHLTERHSWILDGNEKAVRDLSAELNGLFALELPFAETSHLLFCTDTVQGRATSEIIEEKLNQLGVRRVEICVLNKMTTASQHDFAQGVDSLLNICEERLIPLRESGHHIVFNLVGGFKSLQAYLQMLGMIYADEICYLFEAPGSPLLTIPRLPIHFDLGPLSQSLALMARLAANATVVEGEVSALPSIYVEIADGEAILSVWGKLIWSREKQELLSGDLLEHPGIGYEPTFRKDYEHLRESRQRVAFQEAIAKVAVLWLEGGLESLRRDGGLQYETYQNHNGIGHFRVDQGRRISCVPQSEVLVLRHMGSHDYINTNP